MKAIRLESGDQRGPLVYGTIVCDLISGTPVGGNDPDLLRLGVLVDVDGLHGEGDAGLPSGESWGSPMRAILSIAGTSKGCFWAQSPDARRHAMRVARIYDSSLAGVGGD